MKRVGALLGGLLLAAGLALLGASFYYRVVRTPWGAVLLEKSRPAFGGSYVDTRDWGPRDFVRHWELSRQLMNRGLERLQERPAR